MDSAIIQIGDILVSSEIVTEYFCCDYETCRGACCIYGDSGAPLAEAEADDLERAYDAYAPLLTSAARARIAEVGFFEVDRDGDLVTPLLGNSEECVYTRFEPVSPSPAPQSSCPTPTGYSAGSGSSASTGQEQPSASPSSADKPSAGVSPIPISSPSYPAPQSSCPTPTGYSADSGLSAPTGQEQPSASPSSADKPSAGVPAGTACFCAIERAHIAGRCRFVKPISCRLYPIRASRLSNGMTALNLHRWDICRCAFEKGRRDGIRVYEFLREPLIAAYGSDFYDALTVAASLTDSGSGA